MRQHYRTVLRRQMLSYRNTFLIMYLCVYALFAIICIFNYGRSLEQTANPDAFFTDKFNFSVGGMESVTIITLFIVGLNSFKEDFKFYSANGVSRKTFFLGNLSAIGLISIILAVIDTLNSLLFRVFLPYRSMYLQLYGERYGFSDHSLIQDTGIHLDGLSSAAADVPANLTVQMLLEGFLWLCFAYFWVTVIGLLITTLYYRMNAACKVLVSIGVPALLLFILPSLDQLLFAGVLGRAFHAFTAFAWGFLNGYNPYIGIIFLLVLSSLFCALCWLLSRKAPVKE